MYFNNIIECIYEMLEHGIKIWVEEKNIKVFVPQGIILSEKYKLFIKKNKSLILTYLNNSSVYTKEHSSFIINSELSYAPLSFSQERLWFAEKYIGGSYAYNIPMVFALADHMSIEILEEAIKAIILRHQILRTLIKEDENGTGYQEVLPEAELENFFQISKLTLSNQAEFDHELTKLANHVYNLENEFPIKVAICNVLNSNSTQKHHIIIVIHHIAFDGWSTDIFLKELQEYYKYYCNFTKDVSSSLNLPEINVQYKDFALWQKCCLKGTKLSGELDYWKNKLADYETLNLPIDKLRPKEIDYRGSNLYFNLDEVTSKALVDLSKELKVSLYSVLVSGYYLMLKSFSNQDDIIIGSPVANRHYDQIEDLIGFFANAIALRIKINNFLEIKEFIQQVSIAVIEAQLHQDLPLAKLVEELCVEKDTSRHPIFNVIFALQEFSGNSENTSFLEHYDTDSTFYNVARYDVSLFIDTISPQIQGHFNYSISLYDPETIQNFIETYINILKQFANVLIKQNQVKIADISYINKEQLLINNRYDTKHDYLNNDSLHSVFERQVENNPDAIAID